MKTVTYRNEGVRRSKFAFLHGLLLGLMFSAAAPGLAAQTESDTDADANADAEEQVKPVAVADPYTLHDLGLTILLPEDTVVDTQFVPGGRTKAVLKAPDNSWVIQIFNANSSNTNLTINEVLDNFEQQRREGLRAYQDANRRMFEGADPKFFTNDDRGRSALVVSGRLDPASLTIADQPAGRFYCETPLIEPNLVTGYTVFRKAPGRFIIFQLDCMREAFGHSQRVYETVVASSTFENVEEENTERATALLAGKSFLETVSNEDIEAILSDEPQFFRIYRPAPTGLESDATELGWQRIQMRLGQRGEVDPTLTRDRWSSSDREYGYLVKIDLVYTQRDETYESQTAYFLDRTRSNETISILNRRLDKGKLIWSSTITGIRRGSMLTLNSVQSASAGETTDWSVPDEYISRVELELLPHLVAHKTPEDSTVEFDFGFYHFNVLNQRIEIRRDKFSNAETVGGFRYESEPSPKSQTVEATLNSRGNLIRRNMPDGTLLERIELDRLREIRNDQKLGK